MTLLPTADLSQGTLGYIQECPHQKKLLTPTLLLTDVILIDNQWCEETWCCFTAANLLQNRRQPNTSWYLFSAFNKWNIWKGFMVWWQVYNCRLEFPSLNSQCCFLLTTNHNLFLPGICTFSWLKSTRPRDRRLQTSIDKPILFFRSEDFLTVFVGIRQSCSWFCFFRICWWK